MKIGIITSSIGAWHSLSNYTRKLVENLSEIIGDNIKLYLIHKGEITSHEIINQLADNSKSYDPPTAYMNLKWYDTLAAFKILKYDFDIIHVPHLFIYTPPKPFLLINSKVVATLHDLAPLHYLMTPNFSPYSTWCVMKWRFLFGKKTDRIIAVSNSTKQDIVKTLRIPESKIRVIHHGIDHDVYKTLNNIDEIMRFLDRKYKTGSYPFIFHVSQYQPRKNVLALIKAFFKVRRELKEYKLVIAGKQGEVVRRIVQKLNLKDDVVFTGFVTEQDFPKLYNAAEVFVFPSFHEGFGMPILDAMACGCPVITSNVSSMPEIAGDAAILINPYHVDEIANAMYRVLTDENLRKELREKGQRRAKQFSWRKCAEEHLKVYEEVYSGG